MKYLLAAISFALLAPLPTLAATVSDCSDDPVCICSPVTETDITTESVEVVTGSKEYTLPSATDLDACQDKCFAEKSLNYPTITTWEMQCTISGGLEVLGQGQLSAIEEVVEIYYQDPILGVPIPGLEFTSAYESGGVIVVNYLGEYIEAAYNWAIRAAAILAIMMIMIGGLQWALARGNPGGIGAAKQRIADAVTGLVLLLAAVMIATLIDPATTQFSELRIQAVEKVEFIANETPLGFEETCQDWIIDGSPGNNSTGFNGTKMYAQTAYESSPYGPAECNDGKSGGSVYSSGCGVTSFAMAISSLSGKNFPPDVVAESFWEEGPGTFRPKCGDCGCNGTHFRAFVESELNAQAGTKARHIGTDRQADIIALAQQNKMIIYLYRTCSGGGHYVLITGMDEDGNFLVNNPWGGRKERRTIEQVFAVARAFTYIDTVTDFIDE